MISLIPPQVKIAMYAAGFGVLASVGAYGYHLYNKVDALEKEKIELNLTVEQKNIEIQKTVEALSAATQELVVVQEKVKSVDSIAQQRQVQLVQMNSKMKKLGDKIATSTTPQEFEGEVNGEFIAVLACIEKSTGKTDAKCEVGGDQQ